MNDLLKPPRVESGSTIAILAPSSTATEPFAHRLDAAIDYLTSQGYDVVEYPHTRHDGTWHLTDVSERATALTDAFTDPSVDLILPAIGGLCSNTLLSELPFRAIRDAPTAICGYSDITSLHYGVLSQAGVTAFYGPCAITEFGEYPEPLQYTTTSFWRAVQADGRPPINPASEWTDEVLDWRQQLDRRRPRERRSNPGYQWLRDGRAEGPLLGGCLPTLNRLVGTRFWPDHDGAVLLLDIPEGGEPGVPIPVAEAHSALTHLQAAGVFDAVSGVIVSRVPHASDRRLAEIQRILMDVTTGPLVYGVDCGHTDPQATFPLGAQVRIDSDTDTIEPLESGVATCE